MIRTLAAVDRRLLLHTLLLLGLGVVMVYGSSAYRATVAGGTEWSLAGRHTVRVALGLVVMLTAAVVPYRRACELGVGALAVGITLLVLTVLGGSLVQEAHGIGRWLRVFNTTFQPVEIAKLGLALALPWWIDRKPASCLQWRGGFMHLIVPPAVVIFLLMLQPNFGSAMAIGLMCLGIFWVAGVRARFLLSLVLAAVVLCWLAYSHVGKVTERVDAWLGLLIQGEAQSAYAYQSVQALVGLGSGGIVGVGPGMSTMKYLFLPASHTDFIFAIVGEELGFLGAAGLVLAYALWVARAMKIARRCGEGLAYLCALGVGCMVFSYVALNLAVVVGLMPVTGLPLPFLSYGGSALVTNLAGVGVLLSISRTTGRRRNATDRWTEAA